MIVVGEADVFEGDDGFWDLVISFSHFFIEDTPKLRWAAPLKFYTPRLHVGGLGYIPRLHVGGLGCNGPPLLRG